LMASSFPLEVVEAARWAQDPNNQHLSGPALEAALQPLPWDPSVKSLVPFPSVLIMMNSKLDWMQQVGYAFSVQQADVMGSVQRLRWQAQKAGNLNSSPQQVVHVQEQTIVIEPAQPNVVYVPTYNPTVVYGAWGYPAYPPVYLGPPIGYPGYYGGAALVGGIAFGVGFAVVGGLWGWARPSWGYGPHWGGGYVNVNRNVYNNITVNNIHNTNIVNNRWAGNGRPWGGFNRPPTGPVGTPRAVAPAGWHPPGPGARPPSSFANYRPGTPAISPRPGFNPPANNTRPGVNPPANGTRPGFTPPANGTKPGFTPPANGTRPGSTPPANGTRPGSTPPANGTRPGFTPPAGNTARPGTSGFTPRPSSNHKATPSTNRSTMPTVVKPSTTPRQRPSSTPSSNYGGQSRPSYTPSTSRPQGNSAQRPAAPATRPAAPATRPAPRPAPSRGDGKPQRG